MKMSQGLADAAGLFPLVLLSVAAITTSISSWIVALWLAWRLSLTVPHKTESNEVKSQLSGDQWASSPQPVGIYSTRQKLDFNRIPSTLFSSTLETSNLN